MEMHAGFNILDFIVLGIILLSGLFAIMNGFVREVYSLLNWVASYFVATHFYTLMEPFVGKYISNPNTITYLSIFATFCISFIVLAIIGMVITRSDGKKSLTMSAPHWLMDARTRPLLKHGANMLREFVPDKLLEQTTASYLHGKEVVKEKIDGEVSKFSTDKDN